MPLNRTVSLAICIGLAVAAGAIAGCDSGTNVSPEPPAPTHVVIQFAARAGDNAIDCDNTATAMGAAQDKELALRDFRFYVGNVRLVKPSGAEARITLDGNAWQFAQGGNSVALLDFTNRDNRCAGAAKARRTVITGTVPSGAYSGIRFELGIPEAMNHADVATAAPPLNIADLYRDQQDGRWFARLESIDDNGGLTSQLFALASSGCVAGSDPLLTQCTQPYRPTITLTGFTSSANTVIADYRLLLAETDLSTSLDCTPGTSARCQALTARAGSDASGLPAGSQAFFRVE